MELKNRFESPRRAGGWAGAMTAALLLAFAATAVGDLPEDHPNRTERGLTGATTPAVFSMDRNRVIMILTDNGQIGANPSSVAGGGFWIATTNQYIFSSGPNVGATIPGAGDTVVAIGGPFSELAPGGPIFDAVQLDEYFATTNPEDVGNFPEVCTVDEFRVNQFPALAPFAGEPFPGFADQTVCHAVNDLQIGTCSDCAGTRVGVEIVETLFAFGVPSVQDFVFVVFRIFNRTEFITAENTPAVAAGTVPPGPYDLENTIVAIAVDPDIGDAGDDQVAFLPDVQTMVFWDSDFTEPQFQGTPGFGGITYLKTPVDPTTGEEVGLAEFVLFTNGAPRPDPSDKEEWYQLMTGDASAAAIQLEVAPRDVRGMASSGPFPFPQNEFVEIYAAYFFANVFGSPPADLRAEAYKNTATGEIIEDANDDPAFALFRETQLTAQATFNAGFVVPTAPPKPDLELIPGDMQVTLVFNSDPVDAVNPFAKVALDPFTRLGTGAPDPEAEPTGEVLAADQVIFLPALDQGGLTGFTTAGEAGLAGDSVTNAAFDPDFVIQDFQGFRVYRSFSGLQADAQLIAQFDLPDDIAEGLFCLAATAVFDEEGNFVEAVCTESATLPIGTNSGLAFSVVDRGGDFPNPSDGPGLINGIPVSYSVTSFAVNCGQTPVTLAGGLDPFEVLGGGATPAACLVLETGLAPFQTATPESESTARQLGTVDLETLTASGEACNTDEPYATIDLATGEYIDWIDCTNAIRDVEITQIHPERIPDGQFTFVIDSILPSPLNPYDGGYNLAFGLATVWFHWEDSSGGLAEIIKPSVGSYLATFDFTHYAEDEVAFLVDTDPSDADADVAFTLIIGSDFSAAEDLVVNDQSLALGALGGVGIGLVDGGPSANRALMVEGSSLGDLVVVGNPRGFDNGRAYASAGPYAAAGHSFELTWSVSGNQFSGELRSLVDGSVIPLGGQPKGPDNPSTPADFIVGYNWGFVGPGTPEEVTGAIFPTGGPLTNTITLNPGDTFGILFPGQSVYIEGATGLPADGDVWQFINLSGWDRGVFLPLFARIPKDFGFPGPFTFANINGNGAPVGVVNVYPGAQFELSLTGGSNLVAQADLSAITVVPNPFIAANEITRGRGLQRILFTQLPPQATIRIYTISGNLIRVIEHSDGSGTEEWDVRTRFDLLAASGNYYYHVTTPDGRTHLGRFAIVN